MTDQPSLHAATTETARIVQGVRPDQVGAPTPCTAYAVGDLLDHVAGLATAFTWAASKSNLDALSESPAPSVEQLIDDWPSVIPQRLVALGEAWDDPQAWQGDTRAGGVDLPGQVGGLVALNEVLVHGWDLAVATGQSYQPDPALVALAAQFTQQWPPGGSPGAFGPWTPLSEGASELATLLSHNGRDSGWQPAG